MRLSWSYLLWLGAGWVGVSSPLAFGVEEDLRLSSSLATIRATTACRIERLDSKERPICVGADLARRWLNSGLPWSGALRLQVRERFHDHQNRLEILDLPSDFRPLGRWERWTVVLERLRLQISDREASWDRVGIVRSIILGERSLPVVDLMGSFGFGRWWAALGIELAVFLGLGHALGLRLGEKWAIPAAGMHRAIEVGVFALVTWFWLLSGARGGPLRVLVFFGVRKIFRFLGLRVRQDVGWMVAWLAWGVGERALSTHFTAVGFFRVGLLFLGTNTGLYFGRRSANERSWSRLMWMGLGAWTGLAFLSAISSEIIAPWGLLIQLLAAPSLLVWVFPWVFLDLILMSSGHELPAWLSSRLASLELSSAEAALRFLAKWGGWWTIPPISIVASAVLVFVAGFLLPVFKRCALRVRGGISIFVFALLMASRFLECGWISSHPETQVIQRDIGQGDGAWVLSTPSVPMARPTRVETIDAGSDHARSWLGLARELALLRIDRVDRAFFTHWDEDHSGGLMKLSALIPVAELWAPPPRPGRVLEGILRHRVPILDGFNGTGSGLVQGIPSTPLTRPDPMRKRRSGNDVMLGYRVDFRDRRSYLSLGDADLQQERSWVRARVFAESRNWILKLSHHGSKTSTSTELLQTLHPVEAWVSVGAENRYGHPAWSVLDRVASFGVPVHRTDYEGALRAGDREPTGAGVHHP